MWSALLHVSNSLPKICAMKVNVKRKFSASATFAKVGVVQEASDTKNRCEELLTRPTKEKEGNACNFYAVVA